MKKIGKYLVVLGVTLVTAFSLSAQNSLPAPGSGGGGGGSLPAPGSGGSFNPAPSGGPGGPGWGGGGPGWGSPWGPGFGSNSLINSPSWQNAGVENVMACGYDAQGIWRTLPLTVSYSYNGINYNVTVINAWNPWTDMWNRNIDMPAYSTSYYARGVTYNYYAPLSTGTYYFNL